MKMLEIIAPQAEGGWYTFTELREALGRYRGGTVPRSTLYRWIESVGIQPNEHGFYEVDDLKILSRLALWVNRGKPIRTFTQLLIKERSQDAN